MSGNIKKKQKIPQISYNRTRREEEEGQQSVHVPSKCPSHLVFACCPLILSNCVHHCTHSGVFRFSLVQWFFI